MVKISEEEHLLAAGRHIWAVSDHEKDGFHSSNLNSTTPYPPMTKIEPSVDHIHYWQKEKRNPLTISMFIRLEDKQLSDLLNFSFVNSP